MEYEVVISGMAGQFPGCDDTESLKKMLFNKISGIQLENEDWIENNLGIPSQIGRIRDPNKFDSSFFGITSKLGEKLDPQMKQITETGFSAIIDAGINSSDLAGSNTATLVGSSLSEIEYEGFFHDSQTNILSNALSMQAHRIAYYLDLKGPSNVFDSTWNGELYALQYAKDIIAHGKVTAALVMCSNLIFMPEVSYHYFRMGRLNEDGKTKCFSNDADGYSRSEGCVAFFLQRKENAFRNYGTLVGVSTLLYGSKDSPLSDCSNIPIVYHLKNLYKTSKVDPTVISYLEANGSASKVVDAAELNAVAEMFLPERKEPLLIGSIKSNIGHAESASAFVGLAKMIIAAECDSIPPNIYYSSPNELVPSLVSGKLKVVTESTPLKGDYLAINNISASGDFGHAIIKRNSKIKTRKTEVGVLPPDGIPRIILLSGREEEGLAQIIKNVKEMPIDEEFIALTHQVFSKGIKNHIFRAYTILDEDMTKNYQQIKPYSGGERRPVWFVFTGMGCQWTGMGSNLMKLPIFAKTIQFCHDELEPLGIDLINIITSADETTFDTIMNSFVGITAMQIALVDVINEIGLEPDGMLGHSFGEMACAYCDGTISAKEAILAAYNRGKISIEAKLPPGLMAAVDQQILAILQQFVKESKSQSKEHCRSLKWKLVDNVTKAVHNLSALGLRHTKIKEYNLPASIDIACHNSHDNCTISGPAEDVKKYVFELQEKGIFARTVSTGGIAYHSRYIVSLGPLFRDQLKMIMPEPKVRSSKWISTSVPKKYWDTELGKYSSAEYHSNNIRNPVLFEEACAQIPKDAIIIEIAPHGLLQAILKRMLPSATHIPLANRTESNGLTFLLAAFGKLYTEGVAINISKLYPLVKFPVSRGTPSLVTLLNWREESEKRIFLFNNVKQDKISKFITFSNSNLKNKLLQYNVDEISIIPYAAILDTIMKEFLNFTYKKHTEIMFHDIKCWNHVKFTGDTTVEMIYQRGSGAWEINKTNEGIIASGKITPSFHELDIKPIKNNTTNIRHLISTSQIYFTLAGYGHTVHSDYKLIRTLRIHETGANAELIWNGDWSAFLDSIFKIVEFLDSMEYNELRLVSFIERITFNLTEFNPKINEVCLLSYNRPMGLIWGKGITILYPTTYHPNISLQKSSTEKTTEFFIPKFTPYQQKENYNKNVFFNKCLMIIKDNLYNRTKLHVIEILENNTVSDVVKDTLRKHSNIEIKVNTVDDDTSLQNMETKDSEYKCTLVISCSSRFKNTVEVLEQAESGFLIYKGHTPPPNSAVITTQKIANESFFLCKMSNKEKKNPHFISYDNNWKSHLISKLNQREERLVILVAQLSSMPAINDLIEQSMTLDNSHLLRFFFIDSELSSFEADKYEDYLRKDLRVNIFSKGVWGTSLLYPVNLNLQSTEQCEKNSSIFRFSCVKSPDVELHFLGLNVSGSNEKPAVYEYSGVRGDEAVCGIATIDEGNFYLQPDPEYRWIKPKNLNHAEASSVILAYATAYYILDKCRMIEPKSILVSNGLSPLSQAIINLALNRGMEVFVAYNEQKENKELLKNNFLQIQQDHFLNFNKSQVGVALLVATKGKGVDVEINTTADHEMMKSLLKCIVDGEKPTKVFQIVNPKKQQDFTIGLAPFLKGATLTYFYPEVLLSLPKDKKTKISSFVATGFKIGEIKPIKYYTVSSSSLNIDAVPTSESDVQKLVVSMKEPCLSTVRKTNVYLCDSSKFYLILGGREDGWLNLLEWLIKRGARKFIVGLSVLTLVASQRLNAVLANHDQVSIKVYTAKELDFTAEMKLCSAQIDTAFVIGEENKGVIWPLANTLVKTRIVGIGNGLGIFQGNHLLNSSVLIIKGPKLDYDHLLKYLDSLISLHTAVLYMNQSEHFEIESDSSSFQNLQHIPNSAQEIVEAAHGPKKAFWKELRTSSPSYKYCREIPPVFVLPSLKKGQMKPLIRSLFHPAFEAVIPLQFENLQDLAHQLLMDLKRFPYSIFTIICSDWMWLLGLELGKLLEKSGMTVSLILFGVSPQWARPELIKRVISNAIKEELPDNTGALKKDLLILQERVRLLTKDHLLDEEQFKGLCHLITFTEPIVTALQILAKCCQRNINVHMVKEDDYLSMLSSKETAKFVNSNVLFMHKDSARPMEKGYKNILNLTPLYLQQYYV